MSLASKITRNFHLESIKPDMASAYHSVKI